MTICCGSWPPAMKRHLRRFISAARGGLPVRAADERKLSLAEEVTQEVFLALLRRRRRIRCGTGARSRPIFMGSRGGWCGAAWRIIGLTFRWPRRKMTTARTPDYLIAPSEVERDLARR